MPFLTRGGARIHYTDDGGGDPPLLLVHGWCCDRTYLEPQRQHFLGRHRVVAVDLPGHGDSDAPPRDYSIPALAQDVAWLSAELGLERPVAIGHSLGGSIALELAAAPARVAAAVVLDTSIAPAPVTRQAWADLIVELAGPRYAAAAAALIERVYFLPTDDAALRARIVAAMRAVPQHVMLGGMQGIAAWNSETVAAAARAPVLYVASSAPRGDLGRLHAQLPHWTFGQVVGAGHFVQLVVPEQVNAMVERFLVLLPIIAAG